MTRARGTRDRASLAVFSIGGLMVGSVVKDVISRLTGLHSTALGLGIVAGLVGGVGVLRLLSHLFPWIFRATTAEREDTSRHSY